MLLKAAVPAVIVLVKIITLKPLGMQSDTSIAKTNKQLVEQYRDIIT